MLGNVKLSSFYKTNFALMQHYGYRLDELEGMIPWEREIYVGLIMQFLKEQKEKQNTG